MSIVCGVVEIPLCQSGCLTRATICSGTVPVYMNWAAVPGDGGLDLCPKVPSPPGRPDQRC